MFTKGKTEKDGPPPRTTSEEVYRRVNELGLLKFTDVGKRVRHPQYGNEHHWTKRSIFWDLPYWKDNLLGSLLARMLLIDTDSGEESSNSRDNGKDANNPNNNNVDDFYYDDDE